MSEPTRPGQSDFIKILMQLNAAQASAKVGTPAREEADHEMALFLRYHRQGRMQEYVNNRTTCLREGTDGQ